jgi:hypothetical protein
MGLACSDRLLQDVDEGLQEYRVARSGQTKASWNAVALLK